MIYADLHCDTATVIFDNKTDFHSAIHLNHNSLKGFEKLVQCFAVFTNDTKNNGGIQYFEAVADYFLPLVKKEKNVEAVLTVEGGDVLEGNLENLDRIAARNVRIFGLVWNGENDLACGALTNNSQGLKPLGVECVHRLENMNILPDVSHLSDVGFFDVAKETKGKIVATHSNARAVCPNLRNLTDEQIDIIVMRHGLIGLNLYPPFVGENADISGVLRHAEYFLSRGAHSCLCMGCDFDGIDETPSGISDVHDVKKIYAAMCREFGAEIADKIFFKNALSVLGGGVK